MIDESPNLNSADKILEAATKLFAMDSFAAVSIKQISVASGVNSALISYYFGGKKNLYQEVLYTEAEKFLKLQDKIRQQSGSPLTKLRTYVDGIAEMQQQNPYNIHLISGKGQARCARLLHVSPQPKYNHFLDLLPLCNP